MRKQKTATLKDSDIPKKISNFVTPNPSYTQSYVNRNQIINSTPSDDLYQLTQIWNNAKNNQMTLSRDQVQVQFQVQFTEMKNRLTEVKLEIGRLQKSLNKEKMEHEKMAKYTEEKCKTRDTIIEKQNLATNLYSHIQKHTGTIINAQEHCEESRQYLTNLYNNVALKQQEMINSLTEKFKDQVLMKAQALQNQFESKCKELSILETECEKFETKITEQTQLTNEMNSKLEEYKIINDKNEKIHNEVMTKELKAMQVHESNLKNEQEIRYKFEAEISKSSAAYDKLFLEYEALQIIDSGYAINIENLTSSILELKTEETSLNNELDELKIIHLTFISNRELESPKYKIQLQDLTSTYNEATDKLKEAIANNEELSKAVARAVENNEKLENSLKTQDDEIVKIQNNLSDILGENQKLNDKINAQNEGIFVSEKQMCQNTANFESLKANQNEISKREAEMDMELATIKQQLSDECEVFAKCLKETDTEKKKTCEQVKEFKQEIKQRDELITREQENNQDLQREIKQKQSEYDKKLQDAMYSSKKCLFVGHEKQIKEQNIILDNLDQELLDGKLKQKQAIEKNNLADTKAKEKYVAHVNEMNSNYEHLKEQLSKLEQENNNLLSELKKAETSIAVKNSKTETNPTNVTPKPILKSTVRDSPLKVQKVQFDFSSSSGAKRIEVSQMIEESERRYAVSQGANRPDWTKIRVPMISEEPDTTSPAITESQPSQVRKFFKQPRAEKKKTSLFSKK